MLSYFQIYSIYFRSVRMFFFCCSVCWPSSPCFAVQSDMYPAYSYSIWVILQTFYMWWEMFWLGFFLPFNFQLDVFLAHVTQLFRKKNQRKVSSQKWNVSKIANGTFFGGKKLNVCMRIEFVCTVHLVHSAHVHTFKSKRKPEFMNSHKDQFLFLLISLHTKYKIDNDFFFHPFRCSPFKTKIFTIYDVK